jgi:hypothetical protein
MPRPPHGSSAVAGTHGHERSCVVRISELKAFAMRCQRITRVQRSVSTLRIDWSECPAGVKIERELAQNAYQMEPRFRDLYDTAALGFLVPI